jgi:hypothetical protein
LAILAAALLPSGVQLEGALPSVPPSHVVIVIEENHNYSEIIGSSAAPYLNSLAAGGALLTQSFAVAHPSEPNYLAFFSGSPQGITDDSCPNTFTGPNLGAALITAGKTFTGYSEDLPSAGYTGCGSSGYARKHNPWVMFSNVPAASNQPFTAFPSGNFANLPLVSIVVPNLNNDMHSGSIQAGDAWMQAHLASYVQWANTNNALLIVTFDEDDTGNNQIATFFYGPMVQAGQYSEKIDHYNMLRTVEDLYRLPPSGNAAQAAPIVAIWKGASTSYAIQASAGPNGAIAPSGTVMVAQGAKQTFTITPASASAIAGVTVDGVTQGPIGTYTFTNVQAPHTISATFGAPATHMVTASAGAGGTIKPSGTITVPQGGSQAFSITPNTGFTIAGVTVDAVAKGAIPAYTFTNVMADHAIQATFRQNPTSTYTITASAGTGGTISPAGAVPVPQGGSRTFTITANPGFTIAGVAVDGVPKGALGTYPFTKVTANHTIQATFTQNPTATFTITASAGPGGTTTPAGPVAVPKGQDATFTIRARRHYRIHDVQVDGVSVGAVRTYTFHAVQAPHTLTARFLKKHD